MAFLTRQLIDVGMAVAEAANVLTLDRIKHLSLSDDESKQFADIHTGLQTHFTDTISLMRMIDKKCPTRDDGVRNKLCSNIIEVIAQNIKLQKTIIEFNNKLQGRLNALEKQKAVEDTKKALGYIGSTMALVSFGAVLTFNTVWSTAASVVSAPFVAYSGVRAGQETVDVENMTVEQLLKLLDDLHKHLMKIHKETASVHTSVLLGDDVTRDFKNQLNMIINLCDIGLSALMGEPYQHKLEECKQYSQRRLQHSESFQSIDQDLAAAVRDDHKQEQPSPTTLTSTPTPSMTTTPPSNSSPNAQIT